MAKSTGFVLAAGGIAAVNEAFFTQPPDFNWRIVPATAVLALVLAGFETVAPEFGAGLGMLVLLGVLVIPVGSGPSPLQNITKKLGY
jgi:hypothetical protein